MRVVVLFLFLTATVAICFGSSAAQSWLSDYKPPDGSNYEFPRETEETPSALLSSFQSHPLLQVPCNLNDYPVSCFCDTGAQRSVMSWETVEKCGLLGSLDQRYAAGSTAVGIGSCKVAGRLPAGLFSMRLGGSVEMKSPAFIVLEASATPDLDVLLGLDFLREFDCILDLRKDELELLIDGKTKRVPFIRPRRLTQTFEGRENVLNYKHACDARADESYGDDQDETDSEAIDMSGV